MERVPIPQTIKPSTRFTVQSAISVIDINRTMTYDDLIYVSDSSQSGLRSVKCMEKTKKGGVFTKKFDPRVDGRKKCEESECPVLKSTGIIKCIIYNAAE